MGISSRQLLIPGFLFILCSLVVQSCSPGEDPSIEQRITSIESFDVGDAGNSSDIRVRFGFKSIAGFNEVRIIILPTNSSTNFSRKDALKLPADSYHSMLISSSDLNYSERLSVFNDTNNDQIKENQEYQIKILMVGDDFNQLSILSSNEVILSQSGRLSGYYEGDINLMTGNIIQGTCEISFAPNVFAEFNGPGNQYSGSVSLKGYDEICPGHQSPKSQASFNIENDSIFNFQLSKSIITLGLVQHNANNWPEPLEDFLHGVGIVQGDLVLTLTGFGDVYPNRIITLRRELRE